MDESIATWLKDNLRIDIRRADLPPHEYYGPGVKRLKVSLRLIDGDEICSDTIDLETLNSKATINDD